MDKTNLTSKNTKMTSFWGGSRSSDTLDIGQSEYITRLTALRDSLIDQEQMYLAQALDRLRIHSLTNKSSSFRLRMNGDDAVVKATPNNSRMNMLTTVEKFRQMRTKPHHPNILPIQGTPLLEQFTAKKSQNKEANGNSTQRSTGDHGGEYTHRSSQLKIEETFQANLQRLLQPRSSIPNIGRKAIKQQEQLEVKPRPLHNAKTRPHKPAPRQLPSPFAPSPTLAIQPSVRAPQYHDNPSVENRLNVSSEPTLDLDTIQDYCYDYYVGPISSHEDGETDHGDISPRKSKHLRDGEGQNNNARKHPRGNNRVDELDEPRDVALNSSRRNSYKKSNDKNMSKTDIMEHGDREAEPRNTISVFIPDQFINEIAEDVFDNSNDSIELKSNSSSKNKRSSSISHRNRDSFQRHNSLETADNLFGTHRQSKSNGRLLNHHDTRINVTEDGAQYADRLSSRKHIVVDMPSIVFNPATPEPGGRHPDVATEKEENHQTQVSKTSLVRTVKQQELRQRELRHLIEDVRELNVRTDHLTSMSQGVI